MKTTLIACLVALAALCSCQKDDPTPPSGPHRGPNEVREDSVSVLVVRSPYCGYVRATTPDGTIVHPGESMVALTLHEGDTFVFSAFDSPGAPCWAWGLVAFLEWAPGTVWESNDCTGGNCAIGVTLTPTGVERVLY